jgi:ubiquinone/menaquinone biosynthesis C-methylase UbiE
MYAVCFAVFTYACFSEFTHFGKRAVQMLYTLYAPIYDMSKLFTPLRNNQMRHLLKVPIESTKKHLDVATGTGRMIWLLVNMPEWQGTSTGIDCTEAMLVQARKKIPPQHQERVTFMHGDAQHLPFKKQTFDFVTCFEALEHTQSPQKTLTEISRITEDGGYILFTKVRDWVVPLLPFRALSRAQIETILRGHDVTICSYAPYFLSRYELCLARKMSISLK